MAFKNVDYDQLLVQMSLYDDLIKDRRGPVLMTLQMTGLIFDGLMTEEAEVFMEEHNYIR
jgi:hypothetical protein